jgi:hypothetical protein
MYGRTQFISNVITKTQEKVQGFYHLIGTVNKIKDDVQWLLTEYRFMYGDINIEVCKHFSLKLY